MGYEGEGKVDKDDGVWIVCGFGGQRQDEGDETEDCSVLEKDSEGNTGLTVRMCSGFGAIEMNGSNVCERE